MFGEYYIVLKIYFPKEIFRNVITKVCTSNLFKWDL